MSDKPGFFKNAVTEADGVSVNVGYLGLFCLLALDVLLSVVFVGAGFLPAFKEYPYAGVATAIGATWGTFSTSLGALGLFLVGDRRPAPSAGG